jgi:uncharacterized protein (UPF0276 family)
MRTAVASRFSEVSSSIPSRAGIGLRAPHYRDVLERGPRIAWLEVHSENYFGAGGRPLHYLERIRARYPISLHGVGLSLGSTDPLDRVHLAKLKALIERIEPGLVSDHLSWSSVNGCYLNDLLPLPYTEEALRHFCSRVGEVQDYLGREILIENPSTYLEYCESTIPESEFLREVAATAGCKILLDVNNVYVSAVNHGFEARAYLDSIPARFVEEIHLAGFTCNDTETGAVLVDTHSKPVADPVWILYARALERYGEVPTLIEWDSDLPALDVLLAEAALAQRLMDYRHARAA